MKIPHIIFKALVVASTLTLTACFDGSDSGTTGSTSTILSGTAAAGAPIIGQVTVKGALGNTKSTIIEANGNYSVDVTDLTAPYRLRAEGTVGGRTYKLHSYAEEADLGGTVNINPFTDLIIANAASQVAESYFDSNTPVELDPAEIDAQEAALQAKLQDVFDALGVDAAINLLNTSFSADHTGLDAALDLVRIEVDTATNIATITNLIDNTSLTDNVTDSTDNSGTLAVVDVSGLQGAALETQTIANLFIQMTNMFANGLPTAAALTPFFTTDFLDVDETRDQFLTDITTDPSLVGLAFSNVSVSDLTATTATVTFHVIIDGFTDPEVIVWQAVKDPVAGWQLRGDQIPADYWFGFHCNDSTGNGAGACGVNTMIQDDDFTNNGITNNAPFASATATLIDGADGTTVKTVIHLGNPAFASAGELQIFNPGTGGYAGDWLAFGNSSSTIDSTLFAAGDMIQFDLYAEALDISNTSAPAIANGAVAAFTFTRPILFAPSTTPKLPSATATALSAIQNFELGNDLNLEWTLTAGTHNDDILVQISDTMFNNIEIWDDSFSATATSTSIASTAVDAAAASAAGLDPNATSYNLLVRIYADDDVTGQSHSRDYRATIPGPAAGGTTPTTLGCGTESGWDDNADNGLGAPITPYSFADYETVAMDCGTLDFSTITVAGTVFTSGTETTTYDGTVDPTDSNNPGTGNFTDSAPGGDNIDFQWWKEQASCNGCNHTYIVLYSDSSIDADIPAGIWFRETIALTGISGANNDTYSYVNFTEQSNFSDTNRQTGTDGEIWYDTLIRN